MQTQTDYQPSQTNPPRQSSLIWPALLFVALLLGAYFRVVGMNWDSNQHLHPDERFLTMVSSAVEPVESLSEYFDTGVSRLSPYNKGYGFYVYGTLPLFMVRYVAESLKQVGYDQVYMVGRYMSALFDLLVVLLVYIAGMRLYRDPRIAALAAAFYAFAVLPIQLSHFYVTDTFLGFFGFLTLLLAIWVMTVPPRPAAARQPAVVEVEDQTGALVFPPAEAESEEPNWLDNMRGEWRTLIPFVLFGLALGAAAASKVSAVLLAFLLPAAAYIWWTRLPKEDQPGWTGILWRNLVIAGAVSFIAFRIFQPYAFQGPGFFGIIPNEQFVNNIRELGRQSTGDVDFPPALQWARRPITFALQNMVVWGFGLPLGLLAVAGFGWMFWRITKSRYSQHLLLWSWTLIYFVWWASNFSRTMRYQILVYPTLALIAAWALVRLYEKGRNLAGRRWLSSAAVVLGVVVLLATGAWAYAFTRIYTRPVTRVAASEWIYQNVPAAINVKIDTGEQVISQPVGYRSTYVLEGGRPWLVAFEPRQDSALSQVRFSYVSDQMMTGTVKSVAVELLDDPQAAEPLATAVVADTFQTEGDERGRAYTFGFDFYPPLFTGQSYWLRISVIDDPTALIAFSGPVSMTLQGDEGPLFQPLPEPVDPLRDGNSTYSQSFVPNRDGTLREVRLNRVVDWEAAPGEKTLILTVSDQPPGGGSILAQAQVSSAFLAQTDVRGEEVVFQLDNPLAVRAGTTYYLILSKTQGPGALAVYGSKTALESTWDDPLPLPMAGYSPFDLNNGTYRTDLNFEMYWNDNTEKLERFITILNQADYLFITSNRQYATTVRVPERYPLTSAYYRNLIGCPPERDVIWCYATAQPGDFAGNLGYDLVQVFQSEPTLGGWMANTQLAEEAFSVYDHPKVLIFKKRADYDPQQVNALLSGVDLTYVMNVTPRKALSYPANLLLPAERLAQQIAGGTWSELFNTTALINRYPGIGLLYWYLMVTLLGWVVYPLVRLALRGLPDKGYPLSKLVGMLLLAYLTWLAGSMRIPVTRGLISVVAVLLLALGGVLAYLQRRELAEEWAQRRRYFLMVELVTVAFFAVDLLIRLGNPDLWHPYKGGEKPMDFSYFNAVIKSTTFPPYDPWFAGGYINYYYFGFVISGMMVKWLGIVPAVAYNLILPTFFAFLAMGAFSFGWNLLVSWKARSGGEGYPGGRMGVPSRPLLAGLAAAVALLILGNLGTVRMIWHGMMRLAAPNGAFADGHILQKIVWTAQGFGRLLFGGMKLPYSPGDWYWIPSRAIPNEPITEFPFFTFLYGDPHAHLFALPLTLLGLSWALSIVLGRWQWGDRAGRLCWTHYAASFLLGGLAIGSLRPTNTWDMPTYLAFGVLAVLYASLRNLTLFTRREDGLALFPRRIGAVLGSVLLLVGLSFVLFQPFANWYAQGYTSLRLWDGDHTPFWSYFTHWGLFLFVIVTWLVWETRDWMALTPASHLKRLRPYVWLIQGLALLLVLAVLLLMLVLKVSIAWVALPLAAWAGVLILRPGQPDEKRFVLFMVGTALVLTLAVEIIVLVGDIGRMNTVFKFYLQAWTLLSLSAAAALFWLWRAVQEAWSPRLRGAWGGVLAVLLASALLFPLLATADKVTDRMSDAAPRTLDGMAYMPYSVYYENDHELRLLEDYQAIRWMQENVQGSPVIVEGHVSEYRWGSRYTIYTGLPGVVGWNWHQRQQRALVPPEWVTQRVDQIGQFYTTNDQQAARDFLNRYGVKYIVVGQMERALYNEEGINKFAAWSGTLWNPVYENGATTIYEVLP